MILIIDNYDSFVYNLARYVRKLGTECTVRRNDSVSLEEIAKTKPLAVILSPGPCAPEQAGICVDLVRAFGASTPILGVCLGHQAIGEAYGAKIIRARKPVHGKASTIQHDGSDLFHNLPASIQAGRYHSLAVQLTEDCPLKITAFTEDQEIMAIRHKTHPVYGVQFHPESVLTPYGLDLMANFLRIAKDWRTEQNQEQLIEKIEKIG